MAKSRRQTKASRNSVMAHQFSQVPKANIPRSAFNRSHVVKTCFDAGYLIPFFIDEVLPGDTHSLRASLFGRLATPLKPVMDSLFLETFFFFVPNRLVWDNWAKFNGEQDNPGDSIDYVVPKLGTPTGGYDVGSNMDYLGVPTGIEIAGGINALPFRGINLIWNEWFRDQNLQDSVIVSKSDSLPEGATPYVWPHRRGKRHDYFSSSLPWPQKGPASIISLGGQAPITANNTLADTLVGVNTPNIGAGGKSLLHDINDAQNNVGIGLESGSVEVLYADLSNATAISINQLRESFQIQKLLERDARGGTRYTEIIRSHFGVISPDARLQRPEFLGGGTSMVNINPVAQTSETNPAASPQGNLAAFGTVSAHGHGFTKSFTEHGYVIGFVNVRADLTYQQGLNRLWTRTGRYDFYWPALAHLGEQAVLSKEIYCDGTAADDDVWGYQERFAEYRYKPSIITNKFRSTADGSLDVWHYGQHFTSRPVLGPDFIEDNPPIGRTIAVPSEPHFLLDAYFQLRSVRPMPTYGVPGLIDHF